MTVTAPTTARSLLSAAEPFLPAVEGDELVFGSDPPADLEPALRVLHTGVRALLSGRRWWGCDSDTGRVVVLNSAAPVPDGVSLLAVEGDALWDRIAPEARADHPRLFAPDRPGSFPPGSKPAPPREPSGR